MIVLSAGAHSLARLMQADKREAASRTPPPASRPGGRRPVTSP